MECVAGDVHDLFILPAEIPSSPKGNYRVYSITTQYGYVTQTPDVTSVFIASVVVLFFMLFLCFVFSLTMILGGITELEHLSRVQHPI